MGAMQSVRRDRDWADWGRSQKAVRQWTVFGDRFGSYD